MWLPTGGAATRWIPYEPRWPFVYWNNGVLYEFEDQFVAGAGIRVQQSPDFVLPQITSGSTATGTVGAPLAHTATGTGDSPVWWSLVNFPVDARIDPGTGVLAWTPPAAGTYPFRVRLQNDFGGVEQGVTIAVQ